MWQTAYTSEHVWHSTADGGYPPTTVWSSSNSRPHTSQRSRRTALGSQNWLKSHSSSSASGSCWSNKLNSLQFPSSSSRATSTHSNQGCFFINPEVWLESVMWLPLCLLDCYRRPWASDNLFIITQVNIQGVDKRQEIVWECLWFPGLTGWQWRQERRPAGGWSLFINAPQVCVHLYPKYRMKTSNLFPVSSSSLKSLALIVFSDFKHHVWLLLSNKAFCINSQ